MERTLLPMAFQQMQLLTWKFSRLPPKPAFSETTISTVAATANPAVIAAYLVQQRIMVEGLFVVVGRTHAPERYLCILNINSSNNNNNNSHSFYLTLLKSTNQPLQLTVPL